MAEAHVIVQPAVCRGALQEETCGELVTESANGPQGAAWRMRKASDSTEEDVPPQ